MPIGEGRRDAGEDRSDARRRVRTVSLARHALPLARRFSGVTRAEPPIGWPAMHKRSEPAAPPSGDGEPLDWAGFTNRGNAQQAARDFEGAIRDFTAAIELAP